jgi:hypothetical protein
MWTGLVLDTVLDYRNTLDAAWSRKLKHGRRITTEYIRMIREQWFKRQIVKACGCLTLRGAAPDYQGLSTNRYSKLLLSES